MRKVFISFTAVLLFTALLQLKVWDKAKEYSLQTVPESLFVLEREGVTREEIQQYARFWEELQYFPIPENRDDPGQTISFSDTWMEERNYGGERKHEGCDLFGSTSLTGYYPVISMTDGTVEKAGWLRLGGYRIGIRGNSGTYYYYAHLAAYAEEFCPGDFVQAGELLGFLGNTGYGEEGTAGQFPPHLHVGIYLLTEEDSEMPVNPYWPLIYLENKKKIYAY